MAPEPDFSSASLNELPQYYRSILVSFRKTVKSYLLFQAFFASLIGAELTLFFTLMPILSRSTFIAISLGSVFLTCFSYIVLLFYFQAKKPEQFYELKESFAKSCRQLYSDPLSLAESFSKLSNYLKGFERSIYRSSLMFKPLDPLINRFFTACFREDVAKMQSLLLHAAVEEHLKQIKLKPTDLETHASLATTYLSLAQQEKKGAANHERFTKLAIEELKIVCYFAPNDPWVHEQLAVAYRSIDCAQEERQEIEALVKLRPNDRQTLFRLGALYFELAENAQGLKIYEQLRSSGWENAAQLMDFYGVFSQKKS